MNQALSLAVYGCGNMSRSLLTGMGLLEKKAALMYFYTPTQVRAQELAALSGGELIENLETVPKVDTILLAMKPQHFASFAAEIKGKISSQTTVVSVMAGVSIDQIHLGLMVAPERVLRLMPNTPCALGVGVIPYFSQRENISAELSGFFQALAKAGFVAALANEDQLSLVTPYTGSGPGFLFEFARIWSEDLKSRGVEAKLADRLVRETFLGSSHLMTQSDLSFDLLRDSVTSKLGVTAAGLNSLAENGLAAMIKSAMDSALKRNTELSQLSLIRKS